MCFTAKQNTGVSLWEPHVPHNIKAGKTNGTCEGNAKETSSLKASRNTICLCYVIVADGGKLGKSGKRSDTAAGQKMDRKSETKCAPRNSSKWSNFLSGGDI